MFPFVFEHLNSYGRDFITITSSCMSTNRMAQSRLASPCRLRKVPPLHARVVEWQTRTFEGRMPKGMRVQVPPRARLIVIIA
jgi:hypothetical protein